MGSDDCFVGQSIHVESGQFRPLVVRLDLFIGGFRDAAIFGRVVDHSVVQRLLFEEGSVSGQDDVVGGEEDGDAEETDEDDRDDHPQVQIVVFGGSWRFRSG